MEILLIDIDSKIPNLALHKLARWHEAQGDHVHWNLPMIRHAVNRIYASCVFTKNKADADEWAEFGADVGGTGYDLHKTLPAEIENYPCRINWGFTTRGCIRKCPFCFVPEKEGMIHAVGDLYNVWDGVSKEVVLMDNNILAMPKHFEKIANQLIKERIRVDFNQGLDHRLLTDHAAKLLSQIRRSEYRFAFDNPNDDKSVLTAIEILKRNGIKRATWYVLVGFNTTQNEDFYRLDLLKAHNQRAYVMRYDGCGKEYNDMAAWANQRQFFMKTSFAEFVKIRHGVKT